MARFTSAAAVIGIAAGVASLIFAQALGRGFQSEMRDKILANTAHISVFPVEGAAITDWRAIKERIGKIKNVVNVSAAANEHVIVNGNGSTSYAAVLTQEPDGGPEIDADSVTIGGELAARIGAAAGDNVDLITFKPSGEARTSQVRVAGIFRTGLFDYDSTWIKTSPRAFAKLVGEDVFAPRSLSVSAADIYDSDKTAERIRESVGPDFRVLDWQEANAPLFAALALERKGALAIISLIVLIAALNITTTLALLVNERRLDIAILRTCGANARSLAAIFVLDGLILGAAGITIGLLTGIGGSLLANYFRLISLNAEVYSLGSITLKTQFADIAVIILGVTALSVASTLYPALTASRVKPMENLRNQ